MSDDPGHQEAEEILQEEDDNHYGDMADAMDMVELGPEPVWAWCKWCMERRDHDYLKDRKGWFCPYCGKENHDIPYEPRPMPRIVITEIAENYLKDNPEE